MTAYAQSIQFLLSQVRRAAGSLEDGTVTAYSAGTTNLKTIWLDRGKQTEATNPYTLDANGTAALFGDGLYRFVIKSASGTTVYDRDYVSIKDVAGLAYDVSNYASLAAAVSAIGSTPATLQYSSDQTLSSNLTIPANIELVPINGAVINHGAYTISYAGNTDRWPVAQIFNGTGTITYGHITEAYAEWRGAKNDATSAGTTRAAINATLVDLRASVRLLDGMTTSGTKPVLRLVGNGKYLIDGSLVAQPYMDIRGTDSIITTSTAFPFDASYPIFTGTNYQNRFSGITFFGGNDQIRLNTGSANTDVKIVDCQFKQYSRWAVVGMDETDPTVVSTAPHATHLIVKNPVFEPHNGVTTAGMMHTAYDFVSIKGATSNYVTGPSGFTNYDHMHIEDLFIAAPGSGGVSSQVWIENRGVKLVVTGTRFAGETGARTLVANYAGNSGSTETLLMITGNQVSTSSGNPAVIFYDIPDNFVYKDNMGSLDMAPFKYSSTIPAATRKKASSLFASVKNNTLGAEFGSINSADDGVTQLGAELSQNQPASVGTSTVMFSQLVANKLASAMSWASVSAGMTAGTSTDIMGEATLQVVGVNSFTNTAYAIGDITGFAAGVYTLVVNVNVVGNPTKCTLYGAGGRRITNLGPGNHVLNHQFYFNGTDLPLVQIRFDKVDAATTVNFSGYRIFSGRVSVNSWTDTIYHTAMPTTGTFKKGDRVIRTGAAVGSPAAYIRMTTGSAHVLGTDWGREAQIY